MRQLVIGLGLCALLAWGLLREQAPQAPALDQAEFFALGTLVQIKSTQPLDSKLLAELQQTLSEFEQHWTVLDQGMLVEVNTQLASERSAVLPVTLRAGIEAAQQACLQSDGLFDPALGALVELWGFDDEGAFRNRPPNPQSIATIQAQRASLCDAEIDAEIRFAHAGTRLNFGASAKGRAVDLLLNKLKQTQHAQAIVNAGGDLKVLGQGPGRPWRVGIRHPRPDDEHNILATLDLHSGESIFTSGDYERYFLFENQRYHHLIDPRTGWPATQAQSATVIHSDAEWADAASTALFVAGPELAERTMRQMDIRDWLLVDQDGNIHSSDSMRQRIELAKHG